MAEISKLKRAKRFGARYGRSIKNTFAKIEFEHRKLHKCPYCCKISVKRIAAGIWQCKKCDSKFTGKAYSIRQAISPEEIPEEKEEA